MISKQAYGTPTHWSYKEYTYMSNIPGKSLGPPKEGIWQEAWPRLRRFESPPSWHIDCKLSRKVEQQQEESAKSSSNGEHSKSIGMTGPTSALFQQHMSSSTEILILI